MANEQWKQCLSCQSVFEAASCGACESAEHVRSVKDAFEGYLTRWKEETLLSSSATVILENLNFQSIVALGKSEAKREVLSLILEQLQEEPSHLFHAMHGITGENPLRPEDAGRIKAQCWTWLEWGKENGFAMKEERGVDYYMVDEVTLSQEEQKRILKSVVPWTEEEVLKGINRLWEEALREEGLSPTQAATHVIEEMLGTPWIDRAHFELIYKKAAELCAEHVGEDNFYVRRLRNTEF